MNKVKKAFTVIEFIFIIVLVAILGYVLSGMGKEKEWRSPLSKKFIQDERQSCELGRKIEKRTDGTKK